MAEEPKPWIKQRLQELKKTIEGMGRHVGVPGSRIHEMISGKRCIYGHEVEPIAEFLEWDARKVLKLLRKGKKGKKR